MARNRSPSDRTSTTAQLVAQLMTALGHPPRGELQGTPGRVAKLWHETLLSGEGNDPVQVLGRGLRRPGADPVALKDVHVHLVCPHHLTVAFGVAHLAYWPKDRIAPFGRLVELIETCTARLCLQEEAAGLVIAALQEGLGVEAAVCTLEAVHPCHNLTKPRAHRSRVRTLAACGSTPKIRALKELLRT